MTFLKWFLVACAMIGLIWWAFIAFVVWAFDVPATEAALWVLLSDYLAKQAAAAARQALA